MPAAVALLALSLFTSTGVADDTNAAAADLKALVTKVNTKVQAGRKTEADLAPELKEFDALLDKYKGEKTDDVAQILQMKAMLYQQVLKDTEKGDALLAQLKRDYPDSEPVKMMKQQEAAKKLKGALVAGSKFPDFAVKDVAGNPLSIANFKGKIVLLDFWATWCTPCRDEIPRFVEFQNKSRERGLQVIGISMDDDAKPVREFYQEFKMNYPVALGSEKVAEAYGGVLGLPITFLIGRDGQVAAKYIGEVDMSVLEQEIETLLQAK